MAGFDVPVPMPDRSDDRTRTYAGLGVAVALVVGGTLATGLFPSTTPYQVLAGGIIVAGFVVGYATLWLFEGFD